ncbi:hypothetical protein D3C75_1005230 [compost metagenome]
MARERTFSGGHARGQRGHGRRSCVDLHLVGHVLDGVEVHRHHAADVVVAGDYHRGKISGAGLQALRYSDGARSCSAVLSSDREALHVGGVFHPSAECWERAASHNVVTGVRAVRPHSVDAGDSVLREAVDARDQGRLRAARVRDLLNAHGQLVQARRVESNQLVGGTPPVLVSRAAV